MAASLKLLGTSYGGFATAALIPGLATLGALAAVSRKSNIQEWSALGVGGSVGGVLALVVLYGWRLIGPVEVARASREERRTIYAQSLADRLSVLALAAVPGVLLATLISPSGTRLITVAMMLAISLTGLTSLWYAVGVNDPWLCLRREAAPRVGGSLLGAACVVVGGPTWLLPLGVGAGAVLGTGAVTGRVLQGETRLVLAAIRTVPASLRRTSQGAMSEIAAGFYSAGCVALVGAAGVGQVTALFSSGDRCLRAGLISVSTLSSSLQRDVSLASGAAFDTARTRALRAHLVLGLIGGALIAVFGTDVSRLLFGAELAVPSAATTGFAVAFLAISLNTTLSRHVLASQGRTGAILAGTLTGAAVGVPAILWGAWQHGVVGASWGLATGEITVVATLALALARPATRSGD